MLLFESWRSVLFGSVYGHISKSRTRGFSTNLVSGRVLRSRFRGAEVMPSVKNLYLVAYNLGCAAGWGYILLSCLKNIAMGTGPQELYNETEQVLQIVQTAALMEVCTQEQSVES